MIFKWPENPRTCTLDFVRKLDLDPPVTWIAQLKTDGRRRIISFDGKQFAWRAKDRLGAHPVSPEVKAAFESMGWPAGTTVDCEWLGPRTKDGPQSIRVFDLLERNGDWIGDQPYSYRYDCLKTMWWEMLAYNREPNQVILEGLFINPGLVDFYLKAQCLTWAEGIVIRHKDHQHMGSVNGCVDSKVNFYKLKWR